MSAYFERLKCAWMPSCWLAYCNSTGSMHVHLQVKCFAGEEAPKYAPDFVAASCKGFWSGIFGHRVTCSPPIL